MIERERRFLVDAFPERLAEPSRIVQGYLTTGPAAVRVRREDDGYTITVKIGSGLARTEIERAIDAEEFEALWALATDLRIEKRRHRVTLVDDLVAELDLFDGELAGRRIVEVEFDRTQTRRNFSHPAGSAVK